MWHLGTGGVYSKGSRGDKLDPPRPLFIKNPMNMKYFGLNETKLFHFHRILKKIVM